MVARDDAHRLNRPGHPRPPGWIKPPAGSSRGARRLYCQRRRAAHNKRVVCDTAPGTLELVAAIVAGAPHLPGAACRGHVSLFDSPAAADRANAIEVCRGCPALRPCARWAAQHDGQLSGVVAGKLRHPQLTDEPTQPRRRGRKRVLAPHGTAARYCRGGCRCQVCRDGRAAAMRDYRRAKQVVS
jgi:hypothetical protein